MSTSPLKVLQVVPALESGGVEQSTIEIAHALSRANIPSIVASSGGSMVAELEKQGVPHYCMPLATKHPLRALKNSIALSQLIRKERITLVHVRSRAPAWSVWYAAQKTKVPYLSTFHGFYGHQNTLKRLYNSAMLRGVATIAVSHFIAEHIKSTYRARLPIHVIHRGVDTRCFDPSLIPMSKQESKKTVRIFMPGRFTRLKGHHLVIEALSIVSEADLEVTFMGNMSSRENYIAELRKQASTLPNKVHFLEHSGDIRAQYANSDIVISASTKPESFGRTVIEAQAMGCAVVAPDQGENRLLIPTDLHDGLFSPNDANSLANSLTCVISALKNDSASRSETARNHVQKHFEQSQMTEKTLELYQQLWQDCE